MDEPPLTAAQCRERARRCFERAIREESLTAREQYLRQGEDWMLRWRTWSPGDGGVEDGPHGVKGTARETG